MNPFFGKKEEVLTPCQAGENKRLHAEGADDASVSASAVERLLLMRDAEKELSAALSEK